MRWIECVRYSIWPKAWVADSTPNVAHSRAGYQRDSKYDPFDKRVVEKGVVDRASIEEWGYIEASAKIAQYIAWSMKHRSIKA
jgi:hypothetical protein